MTTQEARDENQGPAKSQAPFDLATELVDELHTAPFKYSVDVSNLPCEAISTTECFATYMTGFCQYYATTMAVLMRDMGVPARIVEGFLPGTVDRNSGNETIPFSSAHAWVEVYFPGFGWTMFDPTGGGLSQVAPLPSGPPLPSATPGSSLRSWGSEGQGDVDTGALGPGGSVTPPSPPLGPFVAVGASCW